ACRRASAGVPGEEAPRGDRRGRVRRDRGARHARGPSGGAGRRDRRRVRRARAAHPARGRHHLPRRRQAPDRRSQRGHRAPHLERVVRNGRRVGARPFRARPAAAYLEAFRHPERVLSTAMMGVTVAHIVAASATTWSLLPTLGGLAPVVVTLVLTPVMLVFGEIIPKAVARAWATSLILRLYRPLTWTSAVLIPLVAFANLVVAGTLRLFGARQADTRAFVSREELKALLQLEPGE